MLAIYTSANYQYFDRVLTLASSIKRHYPNAYFCFLLSERAEDRELSAMAGRAGIDEVLLIKNLSESFSETWIFGHNVIELCTAVKGAGAAYLFEKGFDKVIYLDPDTVVFRRLEEVESALDTYSCVLTPHICAPTRRKDLKVIEHACFRHGVFNLGFGAWRNDEVGREIVGWWHANLVAHCYEEPWNSLYTDQKFFDLVPAIFEKVMILKNPAYNLATWNLESRSVAGSGTFNILVNGMPLAFFHFAGSGGRGQGNFSKWFGGMYPQIEGLWGWYASECARWGITKPSWSYGRYGDGREIEYEDRVQFRQLHEDVRARLESPFRGEWKRQLAVTGKKATRRMNVQSNEVAALRAEIELLKNSVPVRLAASARRLLPNSVVRIIRRAINAG